MNSKHWMIIVAIIAVAVAGIGYWIYQENQPGKLDGFAKCLSDKDAKFYGAFWCSHCQNQKRLFSKSEKYLPYVECSTQDSRGQLQVCKDQDIKGYPTWKFADGSTQEGEVTLQELANKTSCPLPN